MISDGLLHHTWLTPYATSMDLAKVSTSDWCTIHKPDNQTSEHPKWSPSISPSGMERRGKGKRSFERVQEEPAGILRLALHSKKAGKSMSNNPLSETCEVDSSFLARGVHMIARQPATALCGRYASLSLSGEYVAH